MGLRERGCERREGKRDFEGNKGNGMEACKDATVKIQYDFRIIHDRPAFIVFESCVFLFNKM